MVYKLTNNQLIIYILFRLRSGFRRAANQELIERNNANIQPSYDVLTQNPPTVPSSQGYLNYISALGRVHRK